MPLRALTFDVDGTLADTERDGHRVAFNAAFAEHGLDWHWDEALYGELLCVSGGVERIDHYARAHRRWPVADPCQHERLLRTLHACKTRHYVARVAGGGDIDLLVTPPSAPQPADWVARRQRGFRLPRSRIGKAADGGVGADMTQASDRLALARWEADRHAAVLDRA
jgi:hypothetical protein